MHRLLVLTAFVSLSAFTSAFADTAQDPFALPSQPNQAASAHALSFCRLTSSNLLRASGSVPPGQVAEWQQNIISTRDQSHSVLKSTLNFADYTAFAEKFQVQATTLARDLASAAGRPVDVQAFNRVCEERMMAFAPSFDAKLQGAETPVASPKELVAVTPAPHITKTTATLIQPSEELASPSQPKDLSFSPATSYAIALCDLVRIENLKANPQTNASLKPEEKNAVAEHLKNVEFQVMQSVGEMKRQQLYQAFSKEILEPLNNQIQSGELKTIGDVTRTCNERAIAFGQSKDKASAL